MSTAEVTEVEKALLGGILLDSSVLTEVIGLVDPPDFFLSTHQLIYRTIIQQRNDGNPIDFVAIYDRLGKGDFNDYIQLYDRALPGHARYFAERVKDAANRRQAQEMLRESLNALGSPACDLETQMSYLSGDFLKLVAQRNGSHAIGQDMIATIKQIENQATRTTIKTGLKSLDEKIGGLYKGDAVIVAGRTSMGKSSLAETMCLNVATAGHTCAYVCLEGTSETLRQRLLSIYSGVWMHSIKSGRLRDRDYPLVSKAAGFIADLPIYTFDAERRWDKIKAEIELLKFKDPKLSVVFIDYLGLIKARGYKEQWQEVAAISSEFKGMLGPLDIAGVMLCQINREPEKRKDHRPTLADLRGSGAVEQDADIILLLYRPHYYDQFKSKNLAEVGIAKNRDGPTGSLDLRFEPECVRFLEEVE